MKTKLVFAAFSFALIGAFSTNAQSFAPSSGKKLYIVVIWGDDIGTWNLGAYTHGMMGRTPNIDSIAKTRK